MNTRRHFDQHHIAGNPAITPPVKLQRGHGVGAAHIAHFDNQKVLAVAQNRSRLEIECRESTFVFAQLLSVQINGGLVIGRAEVNKDARVRPLVIIELPPVPHRPFIEHQVFALRIPVSRNIQHGRRVEAVFDAIALAARLFIAKETRLAVVEWIHDGAPRAVEIDRRPPRNVRDQSGRSSRGIGPSASSSSTSQRFMGKPQNGTKGGN